MRDWRDGSEQAVEVLTNCLRTPQGSQRLRPIQAVALKEAFERRGLYLRARVGAGKTLTSALIPTVMRPLGYQRPLILVPANLVKKTRYEFDILRRDWKIPEFYRLESYSALALEKNANLISEFRPDMIICDEANKLRRLKDSAAPKRLQRWLTEAPQTAFFAMSGTFLKSKITDYSHILNWALRDGSPLPLAPEEVDNISAAVDDAASEGLLSFTKHFGEPRDYEHAKELYRERLRGTPGVIISDDKFEGSELIIRALYADPGLSEEFQQLRKKFQRPDGWDLVDQDATENPDFAAAGSVWNVARQLALGFYYTCDPQPPRDWMQARRAWFGFVREVIKSGALDTELQVRLACEGGARPPDEYTRWQELKHNYNPNLHRKAVWLNGTALDYARAWGRQGAGVIWCDHTAFGEKLSELTGWRYFGEGGLDRSGMMIEQAPEGSVVIASRAANQYGRNLQYKWCRSLVMAAPNSNLEAEQMLGRQHRDGQRSPHVIYDFYLACSEHIAALMNIQADAQHAFDIGEGFQKILDANVQHIGQRPDGWAFA
jgi:hypothetical protein